MYKKTRCVAMLLAGGEGSRLYQLTEHTAKPAVSFGGKYRIIDFTLSNCVNSGVFTVGVLTQYQPLALGEYIGGGGPWDLDRLQRGVTILPPYKAKGGGDFYRGTADAVWRNLDFIRRYNPEEVLVLSGDHIYIMDYSEMLERHRATGADCTVGTLRVPIEEASRFGIMSVDDSGQITAFEEKPREPKGDLASMGIYVFRTSVLEEYLERICGGTGAGDFGRDVIPAMLSDSRMMMSHPFKGYWKDVGTIDSLWQANMDLLGDTPIFDLHGAGGKVYSRTAGGPPHYVGPNGLVSRSLVTEGCEICGSAEDSVLSGGVIIEPDAVVRDSVIMSGCRICSGAVVTRAVLDSGVIVGKGAIVGSDNGSITVIAGNTVIPDGEIMRQGEASK